MLKENSGNLRFDGVYFLGRRNTFIVYCQKSEFYRQEGGLRGWYHEEEKPHQDENLLGQNLVDLLISLGVIVMQ